jgi:hypothetical protein
MFQLTSRRLVDMTSWDQDTPGLVAGNHTSIQQQLPAPPHPRTESYEVRARGALDSQTLLLDAPNPRNELVIKHMAVGTMAKVVTQPCDFLQTPKVREGHGAQWLTTSPTPPSLFPPTLNQRQQLAVCQRLTTASISSVEIPSSGCSVANRSIIEPAR